MTAIPGNKEEQNAILLRRELECLRNISSTTKGFCSGIWDGILCWGETRPNTTVYQPCPEYYAGFNSESMATKYCTINGTWYYNEIINSVWTNYTECQSNLNIKQPEISIIATRHLPILKAISLSGYGISLAALIIAFFILASFKKLRCSRNLLHMHLFVSFMLRAGTSIILNEFLFKGVGLSSHLNKESGVVKKITSELKDEWSCKLLVSVWQFSLLANYLWILMEGLYLHNLIFLALFSDTSSITMYVIIGWSLPLLFITPWVFLKIHFEDKACWTQDTNQYYFLIISGPIVISTFINFGLFVNIVRVLLLKLTASISEDRRRYRKWAKSTLVLIPLFGVHYALLIGFSYSIGKNEYVEVTWLYCDQLLASFQGFFVALLYCFMNGEVRAELKKKFGQSNRDIYSDTDRPSRAAIKNEINHLGKKGSGNMESCMISFMSTGTTGGQVRTVDKCNSDMDNSSFLDEKTRDGIYLIPTERCHLWNSTELFKCLEHSPVRNSSAKIRASVLGTMAVISFIGNVLTIASIRKSKTCKNRQRNQSWSSVYALILHLSVSDLFVTVFCIAGEALWSFTVEWRGGNIWCKLFKFFEMFSLYLSTFILVLIGLDRFIAVRYPIKTFSATKRCSKFVIGAWILSFILSLPQLIIFRVGIGPFYEDFYQCVTYGFYTEPWQEQLYTTFSFIVMFMLPLLILTASYVSTIMTISKSDRTFHFEGPDSMKNLDMNRRRIINKAKMKAFKISLVIVVTFIVWWTPYYTMMIIFVFLNPDKYLSEELQKGIFFFGMSNSLVNPVIYGAFHLWKPSKKKRIQISTFKIDYSSMQDGYT